MASFYVCTFGCRCNQADSAGIRAGLCRNSMQETSDSRKAELIIVNSCTVTARSDQQVRQALRRLRRGNPGARLVVTGCYAQRDPERLAAIGGVDMVVGNADKSRLALLLEEPAEEGIKIFRSPLNGGFDLVTAPAGRIGERSRPNIKLQDGCDARCSYCIVPFVRGPARSAPPEDILAEAETLVARGYQEIVLTGVHLGLYGRKLAKRASLLELLRLMLGIPGLGRLRISSIEPMRFDPGIIRLALESPALARHFHIPLQSGSDRILRRMRRPYRAARFFRLVQTIRESLPEAGLGTDVLVGFPGEEDADFEATRRLIERSPLSYLHVFPFSAREGTDAFRYPDRVPPRVIRERVRILRQVSQEKNLAFRQSFVGSRLAAVTLSKDEGLGESVVLTGNYIHARIPSGLPANRLVNIRIDGADPGGTRATVL